MPLELMKPEELLELLASQALSMSLNCPRAWLALTKSVKWSLDGRELQIWSNKKLRNLSLVSLPNLSLRKFAKEIAQGSVVALLDIPNQE